MELFRTPLKWIGMVWRGKYLARLTFYHDSKDDCVNHIVQHYGGEPLIRQNPVGLATRILSYAQGNPVSFAKVKIVVSDREFSAKVCALVRTIPYGEVRTYREVAIGVGHPGSARAVGAVMRSNPVPLIVPCHRVVGTGNRLVGFSAGNGVVLKRRLLEMEGNKQEFV